MEKTLSPPLPPLMKLHTALGDALLFKRLQAREALGELFEFEVEALSSNPSLAPVDLLGQPASVTLQRADGEDRCFQGLVAEMGLLGEAGQDRFSYRLVLRPALWLLTRRADTRIFQALSVPDILKQVLEPFAVDVDLQLTGRYAPVDYCVQYRETDFAFISRLMEKEGIYYFFRHEAQRHTLVVVDAPGAHVPCEGGHRFVYRETADDATDLEPITHWRVSQRVQPQRVALTDYDFTKPDVSLQAEAHAGSSAPQPAGLPPLEIYDYPCDYGSKAEGEHHAGVRQQAFDARVLQVEGEGLMRTLAVGGRFELAEHPQAAQNGSWLVTATEMELTGTGHRSGALQPGWRCRFRAIGGQDVYRSPARTPQPRVHGPQTAVVVGPAGEEIFTDAHGRVKLHFHWDRLGRRDENSSCWVRVSQPWAGQGWGSVSIPRIGQEVIVDFMEGNPDRPIVTGRVYNAAMPPPYGLPAAAATSGIKSKSHKGAGYNEMSMDDTAGKEKITVHAQYDMATTVEHDDTQTVHNHRSITVDGTHTETIKQDTKITISAGSFSHDVAANTASYHVKGDVTETYESKHSQTVTADQTVTVKARRSTDVTADDTLKVGGNRSDTITGHRSADVTGNEQVTAKGTLGLDATGEMDITSKAKITIHVGPSTIELAPGGITLSCGPSTLKIDPSGVSITAPKISLNG